VTSDTPREAGGNSGQAGEIGKGDKAGSFGNSLGSGSVLHASGQASGRTRTSNQVIRRGEGGNDPGSRLPMGYGVPARLLNAVLSTDSASPVVAEITQDVFASQSTLSIPAGSRVIGSASFDDSSKRIQLRFHTFVYPEGDQHGLQGIGLMRDGSAGIAGDYHSEDFKRQSGRFLGNLIGGIADGMKERQASGPMGIPMEAGSLKNGILNGIALSAQDQAKQYATGLEGAKPYMTLEAGQNFVIFLEREYLP
jgi:type IV secretory pathway VirB10-like protein